MIMTPCCWEGCDGLFSQPNPRPAGAQSLLDKHLIKKATTHESKVRVGWMFVHEWRLLMRK